ncbi:hypothetical protein K493DRAFT_404975 [Basidiobolus meristosporus CBS 931.73]|uniref:Uncharacterized protein n=1 Tax=Basidiobolus meristosporus CBS 931.73 TaxID=1314790 RepID=A0A1Y1YZG2_9FUNG|nr:hypothetical protein K493DRAFT_404975 [Basidiobolus meristosporus CBS 931.73]|eukprot:ORY03428.1 hypothetical protein K493DRAFT_404975 [Basidiobolus meristosporus CBS 931.73]
MKPRSITRKTAMVQEDLSQLESSWRYLRATPSRAVHRAIQTPIPPESSLTAHPHALYDIQNLETPLPSNRTPTTLTPTTATNFHSTGSTLKKRVNPSLYQNKNQAAARLPSPSPTHSKPHDPVHNRPKGSVKIVPPPSKPSQLSRKSEGKQRAQAYVPTAIAGNAHGRSSVEARISNVNKLLSNMISRQKQRYQAISEPSVIDLTQRLSNQDDHGDVVVETEDHGEMGSKPATALTHPQTPVQLTPIQHSVKGESKSSIEATLLHSEKNTQSTVTDLSTPESTHTIIQDAPSTEHTNTTTTKNSELFDSPWHVYSSNQTPHPASSNPESPTNEDAHNTDTYVSQSLPSSPITEQPLDEESSRFQTQASWTEDSNTFVFTQPASMTAETLQRGLDTIRAAHHSTNDLVKYMAKRDYTRLIEYLAGNGHYEVLLRERNTVVDGDLARILERSLLRHGLNFEDPQPPDIPDLHEDGPSPTHIKGAGARRTSIMDEIKARLTEEGVRSRQLEVRLARQIEILQQMRERALLRRQAG